MSPSTIRRLALAGATGGLAVALAGCSALATNGPSGAVQPTPLSDTVTVSQPFCTANGRDVSTRAALQRAALTADPGCDPFTSVFTGLEDFTGPGGNRMLVPIQVADGTPAPVLTLRRRPGVIFEQEPAVLSASPEAPAGRHWVGYRSGEFRFALDEPDAGDVVDAVVAIPRAADRPASERLSTTIAIGSQVTADGFGTEYAATRPVDCDEHLEEGATGPSVFVDSTTCPNVAGDTEGPEPSDSELTPTDAAVLTGDGETAVVAGDTATVPFTFARTGTVDDPADVALSASTTVPGGEATPTPTTVRWETTPVDPTTTTGPTPPTDPTGTLSRAAPATRASSPRAALADASTDVPVAVVVPAATAAGVYDVTLKASDDGGSRSATARIRVTAAAVPAAPTAPATPAAPAAPVGPAGTPAPTRKPISTTVKLLKVSLVSRRTRRLHLGRVTCVREKGSGPCVVRSRVTSSGKEIGRISVKVQPRTSAKITLRLTRSALAKVVANAARATTTVSAAGSTDVVRVTKVRAKPLPRKRG
ncbi:hypothetical protein [Patulibacter minatonensis]|uniref:hypothetical protein n=1 Tax=Patulibacter minatonensis TaxID=298163 RepID=UPI00047D1A77|nr:hypothetical protein [Patulibacter minatonensis]